MPKYSVTIAYVLDSDREHSRLIHFENIKAITEQSAKQIALDQLQELIDDAIYEYDIINIDEEADNYVH